MSGPESTHSSPPPLLGVKVVELGLWLAGPACATILADWGAEVVKVEPLGGDPFRGMAFVYGGDINPPFDLDNRGKRSLAVDLRTADGQAVVHDLLAGADVMVTNYRPGGLDRLGLGWEAVHERHPRLVYVSISGYGLDGPERDRAAYDMGAFWSRAGVAAALMPPGTTPPYQRGGVGDHMTATAAAGGAAAALLPARPHRRGRARGDVAAAQRHVLHGLGPQPGAGDGPGGGGPLGARRPQPAAHRLPVRRREVVLDAVRRRGPPLAPRGRLLGRPELDEDPRFATMEGRAEHAVEVIAELQAMFLTRSMAEWAEDFDREEMWWAPIQHAHELPADPQAWAARGFVDVPLADGSTASMVATPVDFDGVSCTVTATVPELGEHTELVLLELGRTWEDIAALEGGRRHPVTGAGGTPPPPSCGASPCRGHFWPAVVGRMSGWTWRSRAWAWCRPSVCPSRASTAP